MLTNHDAPPSYRPTAPVAGGTDSTDSNEGGTARLEPPIPVQASGHASSAPVAVTDCATIATYPGSISTNCHWNQPYKYTSL
jgi:hypothetical protein